MTGSVMPLYHIVSSGPAEPAESPSTTILRARKKVAYINRF
jgi:hypothetical protein